MLFKSGAKGLTGGSERIPVGFGKVRLRSAFAALVGEMLDESTTVEGATMFTWMGQLCGYGLIPDRQAVQRQDFFGGWCCIWNCRLV